MYHPLLTEASHEELTSNNRNMISKDSCERSRNTNQEEEWRNEEQNEKETGIVEEEKVEV